MQKPSPHDVDLNNDEQLRSLVDNPLVIEQQVIELADPYTVDLLADGLDPYSAAATAVMAVMIRVNGREFGRLIDTKVISMDRASKMLMFTLVGRAVAPR